MIDIIILLTILFIFLLQKFMKVFKSSVIIFFCLLNIATVTKNKISSNLYIPKYNTIGHRVLQLEEKYSNLPSDRKHIYFDNMYKIIDDLIDTTKHRLKPFLQSNFPVRKNEAAIILKTIDSVLIEQYFVVCIKVESLSDALTPKKLNEFTCYKYLPGYRGEFCQRHLNSNYFGIDCDLGAILYASIGEALALPIHVIEVPDHNFVRWRFSDHDYINFDNNSANIYPDDTFRQGLSPTASQDFSIEEETKSHFLQDMTENDIKGYYLAIIAISLSHQGRYLETEKLYKEAVSYRPYDALAMNNLSWMYITVPEFKSDLYYQQAYRLSQMVDSLLPRSIEYLDTYSCACAGIRDFENALKIEVRARNKPSRIKGYKEGKTCLEIGETIW